MPIKTYKPYTPSRRQMATLDFGEITKKTPEKSLLVSLKHSVVEITKESSRPVTSEEATRRSIVSSISKEIRMESSAKSPRSNTIRIEMLSSH